VGDGPCGRGIGGLEPGLGSRDGSGKRSLQILVVGCDRLGLIPWRKAQYSFVGLGKERPALLARIGRIIRLIPGKVT
jgi:hypothetical protein